LAPLDEAKEAWFTEVLSLKNGIPSHNQLVLGQQRVNDKSDEITAIPKLLMQLDIVGTVLTA